MPIQNSRKLFTTLLPALQAPFFSTNISLSKPLKTVKLAYASYEATASKPNDIPPFIIMHGLFGSKANWNSLCKAYHQKTMPVRKIIALDARNHGDSPHSPDHTYDHLAEDIKVFLDRFQIKKASLMGHSMGGRAVMLFALKYPEMVENMIVADISPVRTSPTLFSMPTLFEFLSTVDLPKNGPMSTARVHVDRQLTTRINDKGLRQFLLTNLIQKADSSYAWRINLPALVRNFKNIATFPNVESLTYKGPVLFLGGGASDYIQKTDQVQILKIFPNAAFKYIEGAGHWLHSEKPAEFLKITLEFLNTQGKL